MRRTSLSFLLAAALCTSLLSACARDTTKVTVIFDDAGDLQSRGSLQTADVRIGRIGSIKLTKDFRAKVTLHINAGRRIPKNSAAILRTTSLLGEKFVELRPLGDPAKGPFLADGDVISTVEEAPELEFVAEQAIQILGQVTASDVASLIDTSATSFAGRKDDLRTLIDSLAVYSGALASRTQNIGRIVDRLDVTLATVSKESESLEGVIADLATTTRVLAENREKAIVALRNLGRLAAVQNDELDKYRADMEKQIRQIDSILRVVVGQTAELENVVDWLDSFVYGLPEVIPDDFTNVLGWIIPAQMDPRVGT